VATFEDYTPRTDRVGRGPATADLTIRPAVPADLGSLADIQAAREGGSMTEHLRRLATSVERNAATGRGIILVGAVGGNPVGLAKVHYFTPPEHSPGNVAPEGWYLSGVIVTPADRRRGIGRRLTAARLDWIAERDTCAYYFVNARNLASIDLHREFGFVEVTRDFAYPGASFEGGLGILFRAEINR